MCRISAARICHLLFRSQETAPRASYGAPEEVISGTKAQTARRNVARKAPAPR
jgi:hypothetical protein